MTTIPLHTFEAVLEVDEFEVGETKSGDPYVVMRDVTVTTEFEVVQRTVMAFDEASEEVASALARGIPMRVMAYEAGPVLKVAEMMAEAA